MDIERMDQGPVTVLRVKGDIDDEGLNPLRLALLACVREKRANVVMNMSGARYISFMGLGVLVERQGQLRRLGGDLKLVRLNLFAQRTFDMASVTEAFSIHDSEAQAIEGFRKAA
jgi:anti-anti-sigma factor